MLGLLVSYNEQCSNLPRCYLHIDPFAPDGFSKEFTGTAMIVATLVRMPLPLRIEQIHVHDRAWISHVCCPNIPLAPPFLITDSCEMRVVVDEPVRFEVAPEMSWVLSARRPIHIGITCDGRWGVLTFRRTGFLRKRQNWNLTIYSDSSFRPSSGPLLECSTDNEHPARLIGNLHIED